MTSAQGTTANGQTQTPTQLVLDDLVEDQDLVDITGKDRLRLALWCLGALALIFLIAMFLYSYFDAGGASEKIWQDVTKIIPPIATLVIGYFFGARD